MCSNIIVSRLIYLWNNMNILVIGSIAYDNIVHYDCNLKESIEKETLDWNINMSIRASQYSQQSGGTGLNISYNLALLNEKSILLWAIWNDFEFTNFVQEWVNLSYVYKSDLLPSSSSFITLDNYGNQLSVFAAWAMLKSDHIRIDNIAENIAYAIISPTKKECMLNYLDWLQEEWVKIFFDPGQQLSTMSKEELENVREKANYLIVNEHEFSLFKKISLLSEEEIYNSFKTVIITYWENGSKIIESWNIMNIPAVKTEEAVDPTGVWEAYRAGLVKWITSWLSWETSWKIGSLLASFCIESNGWQNHFIDIKQFQNLFLHEFGEEIELA